MKKQIISWGLMSAMAVALLGGCAKESAPAQTTAAATEAQEKDVAVVTEAAKEEKSGDGKVKELDMFWFADGSETDAMQLVIDDYEELHPDIKINLLELPFDEMENKIMMAVSGGEAPALSRTTESILSSVHPATLDLGEYVDKDEFIAQFLPVLQNFYVINGKICAAPTNVTGNGMLYNKTAFDKAGVKAPTSPDEIWTWDEFTENVKKVMKDGGVQYGLVIDNPTHRWSTMLYQFGGHFLSPEGPDFDTQESIDALNYTKMLFDEGIIPKSTWLGGEDAGNLFRSGQVAVHWAGDWMINNYNNNIKDFEWGVMYMPKQKQRSSVPGGAQIAAFAGTGLEQEAVDFIQFATSKEENEKYCKATLALSSRVDNSDIEYSYGSEYFAIFSNELANSVPDASFDHGYPNFASKVFVAQEEGFYEIISGKKTAEEHVKEIQEIEQELFD